MLECSIEGCTEPCKPRSDRPGKFYTLCVNHFNARSWENAQRWRAENEDARKEHQRRYREVHPEKDKQDKRDWYLANVEHARAQKRAHSKRRYEIDRETEIARVRQYLATPEGKASHLRAAHRRRALNSEGHYTETQLQARIDFYGRRCYLCGCDWDALSSFDKTIDHVIPLSRGGTNWPANLRPACRSCNSSKFTSSYREAGR